MPRLSQQAATIGVGRVINMAAGTATLVILARVLPNRDDYGAICQLLVLYMALSQIFAVGLPQTIYYFLPRYSGGELRGFLTQTVTLLMLSGIAMGAVFFLGADIFGKLLNTPQLPVLLRIFAVYPVLMMPTLAVESTLLHRNRATATVVYNAVVRVGTLCGLVVPSLLHLPLPQTVMIWMGVAAAMWALALGMIFTGVRGLPFIWRPHMLREEWIIAFPLALMSGLTIVTGYLDRFFVSHLFGAAIFGAYTNATLQLPTVSTITNASAVVLTSELCKQQNSDDDMRDIRIWRSAIAKTGVLIFASLGFFAVWGHETMRVLFTNRFAESGTVFSIAVWGIPNQLFMLQPLMLARGAPQYIVNFGLLSLAAQFICVIGLGIPYGLYGIVIGATLSQYLVNLYCVYWFSYRFTKIGWRAFLPWRVLGVAMGGALLAGVLTRLLLLLPVSHWPGIVVLGIAGAAFCALYLLALYLTGLGGYVIPARFLPSRTVSRPEVAT